MSVTSPGQPGSKLSQPPPSLCRQSAACSVPSASQYLSSVQTPSPPPAARAVARAPSGESSGAPASGHTSALEPPAQS